MTKRTRLEDLEMSRIEKLLSDIRMIGPFDAEIIHRPAGVYKVKIRVTFYDSPKACTGGQMDAISTFCSRRGLSYIVTAIDQLEIEIY